MYKRQVQTIRDLLDHKAVVTSVTTDKIEAALAAFHNPPDLIITDSQVFSYVYERKPEASKLTSFSALMARYKGDIAVFAEGAQALDQMCIRDSLMPVEDVFSITGRGTVATGRVERGTLNMNDEVELTGLMDEPRKVVVTGIEMFRKLIDSAEAGDNIGALRRGFQKNESERGQVLSLIHI